uniref:Hexosyltransferase n=1 Tax=Entomoneis paludosa TaxID=265537 RepID=A0A7S3DPD0_9STRA
MTFPPPPYQYKWLRPKGFLTTDTYKTYGNASDWVDEWHNMPVSDCQQWKKETVVSPVDTDVLVKDTPTTTPIPSNKSIAYITYGYLKPGSEPRFEMFIKGALETWLQGNDLYYVLNLQFQEKLESICMQEGYQEICSRLYPIYVQCTERYYGASPCCKMEQGLLKMIQEHDNYEWYVYQDDDMYIRTDYLEEFVKPLPSHEAMVLTAKPTRELGHTWDGDHRLRNNCSSHVDFKYPWGQPIIYSKPALQEVSNGFALKAMSDICQKFGITHDVGNPILHWMYLLPEVRLPTIPARDTPSYGRIDRPSPLMGMHGFGRPNGRTTRNTTDVHQAFSQYTYPTPPYQYTWHRPKGYMQTETYRLYGNASSWKDTWHTIPISDCQGPVHDPWSNSSTST